MSSDEDYLPDLVSHVRQSHVHCVSSSEDEYEKMTISTVLERSKLSSTARPSTSKSVAMVTGEPSSTVTKLNSAFSDSDIERDDDVLTLSDTDRDMEIPKNALHNVCSTSRVKNMDSKSKGLNSKNAKRLDSGLYSQVSDSGNEDELPDLGSRVRGNLHTLSSSSDDDEFDNFKHSSVVKAYSPQASKQKQKLKLSSQADSQTSTLSLCYSNSTASAGSSSQVSALDINLNLKRSSSAVSGVSSSADSQSQSSPPKRARTATAKAAAAAEEKVFKQQAKAKQQEGREAKKRALEAEKRKKRLLQEASRHVKPGECMKHISVSIDVALMNHTAGAGMLSVLQNADIKYEVKPHPLPNIIAFWREVMEVKEGEDHKIESVSKEVIEGEILVYIPSDEFVPMVFNFKQKRAAEREGPALCQFVKDTKKSLEGRNITLIVHGMQKYFRGEKTKQQRAYRKQVAGEEGTSRKNTKHKGLPIVTHQDLDEALVDLQIKTDCTVNFCETDESVAKCVLGYTKAVAEAPFKREKNSTGFSFHISSKGSVKTEKDGRGLSKVWRQQAQQFKNVTAEVANAILAVYRSPKQLAEAFDNCATKKEAEEMLQDIEVRRGVGVLATTRRVGKELSRRFHQFMTAKDGEIVII